MTQIRDERAHIAEQGMYDSSFEHDNCGIGAVVNIKGIKTHKTVSDALRIVENLEHRAGKDAEGKTGDGVGILLQISHKFFKKAAKELGVELGEERDYGIGMFFFPQNELQRKQAMKMFEIIVEKEGLEFLCWRKVPTNPGILGHKAVAVMPYIMQAFVKRPKNMERGLDFDRKLFVVRRVFEQVRSISSATEIFTCPGRVDSPPTSMISAPSLIISSVCFNAASRSPYFPPSEKESGVTFRIPIT